MTDHEIQLNGAWYNNGNAGVQVWCNTCNDQVAEDDSITVTRLEEIVRAHVEDPNAGQNYGAFYYTQQINEMAIEVYKETGLTGPDLFNEIQKRLRERRWGE